MDSIAVQILLREDDPADPEPALHALRKDKQNQ